VTLLIWYIFTEVSDVSAAYNLQQVAAGSSQMSVNFFQTAWRYIKKTHLLVSTMGTSYLAKRIDGFSR
jgi:hypothetical protein